MNNKDKGHDIDFFRGNVQKDKVNKSMKNTIDESYADLAFKFNNKKVTDVPKNNSREMLEEPLKYSEPSSRVMDDNELMNHNNSRRPIVEDQAVENNMPSNRKPLKPERHDYDDRIPPKPPKNKRREKKGKGKKIIIGLLLILLLLLIALFGSLLAIRNFAGPVHFMVIGLDQRPGQPDTEIRADALMNVNVGSKSNEILMASVPRDTYTYLPCIEQEDKITHAFIFGATKWNEKTGGVDCTLQASSNLLDINMDKYVRLNFDGMMDIIDAIGGVNIKSTGTFCEQDSRGRRGEHQLCFEEGKTYHMDGEMALAYSRHRKTDNDIARGLRQQEVFRAMISKVRTASLWQWPGLYTRVSTMVDTNLSHIEMLQIAMVYATDGKVTNFEFDWNGVYYGGVSYVELDKTSIKEYKKKVTALE